MDWNSYYSKTVYPLMDNILSRIAGIDSPFYLSGGTALHKFHYNYRYSDDLDLFVNGLEKDIFKQYLGAVITSLQEYRLQKEIASETFLRLRIATESITTGLRVDFVNDVPFYFGEIERINSYAVDNSMNILANKLSCLDRLEPKDYFDVWAIWKNNPGLDWRTIFTAAQSKASGIYPPQVCKQVSEFPDNMISTIKLVKEEYGEQFIEDKNKLIKSILES